MSNPSEFFDLDEFDRKGIFIDKGESRTVLNRQKEYLTSFFQDSWPLFGMSGLFSKTGVIHEDRILERNRKGSNPFLPLVSLKNVHYQDRNIEIRPYILRLAFFTSMGSLRKIRS